MRSLLVLLLLILTSVSFSQYPFSLTGTTPDDFNNKKIYLKIEDNYSSQPYKIVDSAVVKQGKFAFKGTIHKVSEKAHLYANAKEISGFVNFVVDSGKNEMIIKSLPPKWPLYKNKLSNAKLPNSPSNVIRKAIDSLSNHYFITKGKPSERNKYSIELDAVSRKQMRRDQMEILKVNPNVFYSILHLYGELKTGGGFKIDEAAEVFDALDKELQVSVLGAEVQTHIAKVRSLQIGNPVATFAVNTDKLESFTNSTLNGTPYIIAFGATWCKPCKERMPMLHKLYEQYEKDGLQVVYVNLDENTPLWKKQIEQYNMGKWINLSEGVKWEESEMVNRFNITGIPFYLIVNREGKIAYNPKQLGDSEYEQLEKAVVASLN